MDSNKKKTLIQSIKKEIETLKEKLPALQQLAQPVAPDNAIGRLTRMEAINSKSINAANLANAKARLTRLEEALSNANDPDFGRCQECDEPIPYKRLLILPDSSLCVRCAGKMDG